jgi:putative restriction endonuclease
MMEEGPPRCRVEGPEEQETFRETGSSGAVAVAEQDRDVRIRMAAFEWLADAVRRHGDVLPRSLLEGGFEVDGTGVPLVGPQGIFKPRVLEFPLSITTTPRSPYDDAFGDDGLLRYRYRGTDPGHPDNAGLRQCMVRRLPLVYFHGIVPGKYVPAWPAYVVDDDPKQLRFTVAVDDARHAKVEEGHTWLPQDAAEAGRRAYVTATVRVRLHQRAFRERVLQAYRRQCAFCRLRYEELLDAAHIVPDADPRGEPRVQNGLALCSLHHAAFDRMFLGVRPDYVIEVRRDVLDMPDGPTLEHAIQGLHRARLVLPTSPDLWPDRHLLEVRYEEFRRAV